VSIVLQANTSYQLSAHIRLLSPSILYIPLLILYSFQSYLSTSEYELHIHQLFFFINKIMLFPYMIYFLTLLILLARPIDSHTTPYSYLIFFSFSVIPNRIPDHDYMYHSGPYFIFALLLFTVLVLTFFSYVYPTVSILTVIYTPHT